MITRGQIVELLEPTLHAVFGDYKIYPDQWKDLFSMNTSEKQQEIEVEMKYLGPAPIKKEGANFATDSMGQRTITTYEHVTVGLAFTITKEAIEDNLYKTDFPNQVNSLKKALSDTKNTLAANVFNNAFSTNHPIGDGQPACAEHQTDVGSYFNTFRGNATVDLSEASLEEAIINIQGFTDHAGILTITKPELLSIPPELQFAAIRLLKSQLRVGTANNDVNAMYVNNYMPKGYQINHYLTSPTAWFIKTDAQDGLKHFKRTPVETNLTVNPTNNSLTAQASERYSFGISNPRGLFGSRGIESNV